MGTNLGEVFWFISGQPLNQTLKRFNQTPSKTKQTTEFVSLFFLLQLTTTRRKKVAITLERTSFPLSPGMACCGCGKGGGITLDAILLFSWQRLILARRKAERNYPGRNSLPLFSTLRLALARRKEVGLTGKVLPIFLSHDCPTHLPLSWPHNQWKGDGLSGKLLPISLSPGHAGRRR